MSVSGVDTQDPSTLMVVSADFAIVVILNSPYLIKSLTIAKR